MSHILPGILRIPSRIAAALAVPATMGSRSLRAAVAGMVALAVLGHGTSVVRGQAPPPASAPAARVTLEGRPGPLSAQPASPDVGRPTPPSLFERWIDLQAVTASFRYRWTEDSAGVERSNGAQWQEQVRARLKLDAQGRYSVHLGLFTGATFNGGWNATGIGMGDGTATMFLKQLFVAAEPVKGFELQYGSLYPHRGQHTELTAFDNDAYISGGRVSVRRPDTLYFDEVAVTIANVSDLRTANVFRRLDALGDENYRQLLVVRRFGTHVAVSADYTRLLDNHLLRQAARVTIDTAAIDAVRVEWGVRLGEGPHDTTFAATLEKRIRRLQLQGGYVHADPVFGLFNGDRYGPGNRVFSTVTLSLPWDLSLSVFGQKQVDPPLVAPNDKRGEIVLQWNALETIRRAW